MTGKFSTIDPERCKHYARFMSNLTLDQANGIFALLFISVLVMMCLSSLQHHKSTDLEKGLSSSELNSACTQRRHRRLRRRYLGIVYLCLIFSIICAVFECFALFNIQYCDGEDLMQLYWSFYSVLQVGSIIAIFGVAVQFWIILGNVQTPSWAVALGTPVLVAAAVGWIFREIGKRTWRRCMRQELRPDEDDDDEADNEEKGGNNGGTDRWLSRAPTLDAERNNSTGTTMGGIMTPPSMRRSFTA